MAEYLKTHLTVKCFCGKFVNIRTDKAETDTPCWNCPRGIHVHLGTGKNNFRITIEGKTVKPIQVAQEGDKL